MKIDQFLKGIEEVNINQEIVTKVEEKFACTLQEDIKKIVSYAEEGVFFDTESVLRLMSSEEIILACEQLHVDFKTKKIIPIFDTGENNFIVINTKDNIWSKFNIIDEIEYKKTTELKELLV